MSYLGFSFQNEECNETSNQERHAKVNEDSKQQGRKITDNVVSLKTRNNMRIITFINLEGILREAMRLYLTMTDETKIST